VLPSIGEGTELSEWILQDDAERPLILVEPSAGIDTRPVSGVAADPPASASLLVGPEGGWSPAEIASAVQAGYAPITLGRRTLRADAVAIVAIAVLQHVWRDL